MNPDIVEAVWVDASVEWPIAVLIETAGLSEAELRELVSLGALVPRDPGASDWVFDGEALIAAQAARRLRDDFSLDVQGVSVALALLERIRGLEAELRRLRAQGVDLHR